jgi:hypothetical protein
MQMICSPHVTVFTINRLGPHDIEAMIPPGEHGTRPLGG